MTQRVLEWATQRLRCGESVALASVISAQGSVPGKPGAHLAISDSGESSGTVGGAGLEMKVIAHLNEMLQESAAGELSGGRVETYQLRHEALLKTAAGESEGATPLDSLCGGVVTVSMEVLEPMPHLLLCGGGHCAQAIADASAPLGWEVSVFDVREEFADPEMWPDARERICSSVSEFLDSESGDSLMRFSNLLLLGHDWKVDEQLLIGMLQRIGGELRPRIGVIGSRAKWQSFVDTAVECGISQDALDSVICPIGVNIGAESPQEIAIAVLAEIIAEQKAVVVGEASWRVLLDR